MAASKVVSGPGTVTAGTSADGGPHARQGISEFGSCDSGNILSPSAERQKAAACTRSLSPVRREFPDGTPFAPCPGAMDPLTAIAASGLRARMESLDLLANNV